MTKRHRPVKHESPELPNPLEAAIEVGDISEEIKESKPAEPKVVHATPAQILEMINHMDESNWRKIMNDIKRALAS